MTVEERITEREILNMMLNGTIDKQTMAVYATKKLAQLDKRNSAARRRAEKNRVTDPLTEAIFNLLADDPLSREDVFEILKDSGEFSNTELTIGKVSYRLSALCRERPTEVIKQEATIADDESLKHKKIIVYTRIK